MVRLGAVEGVKTWSKRRREDLEQQEKERRLGAREGEKTCSKRRSEDLEQQKKESDILCHPAPIRSVCMLSPIYPQILL